MHATRILTSCVTGGAPHRIRIKRALDVMIIAANISALHVLEFSLSIVPDTQAFGVPCQPMLDKSLDDCFPIVAEQVVARGGADLRVGTLGTARRIH